MASLVDREAICNAGYRAYEHVAKSHQETYTKEEVQQVLLRFMSAIHEAPVVEAIPTKVMQRQITGICAADQCDQAGDYDYALKSALQTVLEWRRSPRYKETEEHTALGQ